MEKIFYWIKKSIHYRKVCSKFCPTCKYYEICKQDEIVMW